MTNQQPPDPPIKLNLSLNGTNNTNWGSFLPPLPPLGYGGPPPAAPAPGQLHYSYGAPVDNGAFLCAHCGKNSPIAERRIIYGADGVSVMWIGCYRCAAAQLSQTATNEYQLNLLRDLSAQAAAYVQICHDGGDWDLLDKSPAISESLFERLRLALGKSAGWNPSEERRHGKL